jgi:two-component system OmpR family sensor kinase
VLLGLIPLGVALAAGLTYQLVTDPLPVLVFRADAGTLILLAGILLSLAGLGIALAWLRGERRRADALEEQRRAQVDAHRRFLRRLDHEMKNPLTALKAGLANVTPGEPVGQATLDAITHPVDRLARLVNDLRKLAELEERPLEQLPVDVAVLLGEVVEEAAGHPSHAGRDLRLNIASVPWPLPPVTGDRDLLWLALYNLVDNALKYSRPQDPVEVRASDDGRVLTVEVADSGPGIDPADQPRVFEELFRGANARGQEGSGLGLALAQRVIARHGGEISVRSRQSGAGGTVFAVRLPVRRG